MRDHPPPSGHCGRAGPRMGAWSRTQWPGADLWVLALTARDPHIMRGHASDPRAPHQGLATPAAKHLDSLQDQSTFSAQPATPDILDTTTTQI